MIDGLLRKKCAPWYLFTSKFSFEFGFSLYFASAMQTLLLFA